MEICKLFIKSKKYLTTSSTTHPAGRMRRPARPAAAAAAWVVDVFSSGRAGPVPTPRGSPSGSPEPGTAPISPARLPPCSLPSQMVSAAEIQLVALLPTAKYDC